ARVHRLTSVDPRVAAWGTLAGSPSQGLSSRPERCFPVRMTSTDTKTWLITGAARGMGVDFAQAALAAGHNVVATGRDPDSVRSPIGEHERLLATELDVTDAYRAERAVAVA